MATKTPKRRGHYWLQDGDLTMHIQGRYDPETESIIVQVARQGRRKVWQSHGSPTRNSTT